MKLKFSILIVPFILFHFSSYAQIKDGKNDSISELEEISEHLVQQQLIAYNNKNIDLFLELYSDSVSVYNYPDKFLYKGKEKMKEIYSKLFVGSPGLNCELISRTVFQNKVIDRERVTGFGWDTNFVLEVVAIYTIEGDKIKEVRFIRKM